MNISNNVKNLAQIVFIAIVLIGFNSNIYSQSSQDYELVSIDFQGDIIFSESELSSTILSKESPGWFSQFFNSFTSFGNEAIFFNPTYVNTDIRRLKSFYKDRGYFEIKIEHSVLVDSTNNDTELIYEIFPGDQAIIKNFKITGLEEIYPDFIEMVNDRVTLEVGEYYSVDDVNETRSIVLNFLGDNGYMNVNSKSPEIWIDTLKNDVEINLEFIPGKRYKIKDLISKRSGDGMEEVSDSLLLDLIDIEPGDYFSNEAIQLSQIRLYRTNLFNSALILPVRKDTVNNQVPLEILTNVGKIHQITPEFVLNDENQDINVGLSLQFSKRNFLGGARKLTTTFSVASTNPIEYIENIGDKNNLRGYFDTRISLEQPQFFGKPINTVFESYLTSRNRDQEFDALLYGGSISFNFDLPRFTYVTSLSTYLNFEHEQNTYDSSYIHNTFFEALLKESNDTNAINNEITEKISNGNFQKSKTDNTLIGINIGMNNTNDNKLIFPTKGQNFNLLLESGNAFNYFLRKVFSYNISSPEYFKIQLSSSMYFPFFGREKSAFAFRLKSGIIHAYTGNKFNIPLNQRFYSGGANSVRSFAARKLKANAQSGIIIDDIQNTTQNDFQQIYDQSIPPGGFFLLEFTAEARIHLFGDFGSAFFVDFGNTWDGPKDFTFNESAVAAGFGIRYYSPFAPIRIDIAFNIWDPKYKENIFQDHSGLPDDYSTFKFQIGIGESF